jgi:excisionase family DNA binding protein
MVTEQVSVTLTKADLARLLRVSVRTIERLRRAGRLPASVPGLGRPRYSVAAILEWIDRGTMKQVGK